MNQESKKSNASKGSNGNAPQDPFQRLVSTQTISSTARRIATKIPQTNIQPDSLDLALASTYDHHAIWGAARPYIVKQEKSCMIDHAEEFKQKLFVGDEKKTSNGHYREARGSYRDDPYHVQFGIAPYHASNSRRGYGRSQDGSFYST